MSEENKTLQDLKDLLNKLIPDLNKMIADATEKLMKNSPRILICGPTGVGKSTIINKVFREEIEKTGTGEPVTKEIREHKKEKIPIIVLDTPGFELGKADKEKNVIDYISEKKKLPEAKDHVHIMWYCVSGSGARFQSSEIEFINKVKEHLPVVILLTKSDHGIEGCEELAKYIGALNLDVRKILCVSSKTGENLDNLITITRQLIPEAFRNSLINAQEVNIQEKEETARKWIYGYISSAAITGFSPIPFSSWMAIVPIQLSMLVHIGSIFGINLEKELLKPLVIYAGSLTGATLIGRFISNLAKFIPGIGTLVGGVLDAGIAASITLAMGSAYIKLLSNAHKSKLKGEDITNDDIEKALKEEFEKAIKEQGNK